MKDLRIAIIGLGYVGLPIALEFARKGKVVGFDINTARIEQLKKHEDPSCELSEEDFQGCDILFTADENDLQDANFYIVAVPTPIDKHKQPDLKPLLSATKTVANHLTKGDYVVFESTVYPGCTEDDCVPVLEEFSGLQFVNDFKVGYSPERINPGDKVNTLTNTVKVVSGCDAESLEVVAKVYEQVIKAGVHRASNIKVAEAAKIIENTQRDINIGLMNELSIIFGRMGINTYEVLEAAGTKWNFLNFFPGLVGGHCIGVDPYYLVHKAKELSYHPQLIGAGRFVNDSMGRYVGKQIVKRMIKQEVNIIDAKVLVLGVTFKENVSDIRNSKVVDIVLELEDYGVTVDIHDPYADATQVYEEYNLQLKQDVFDSNEKYDAVVLSVAHDEYKAHVVDIIKNNVSKKGVFVDVKGVYRDMKIEGVDYWSL